MSKTGPIVKFRPFYTRTQLHSRGTSFFCNQLSQFPYEAVQQPNGNALLKRSTRDLCFVLPLSRWAGPLQEPQRMQGFSAERILSAERRGFREDKRFSEEPMCRQHKKILKVLRFCRPVLRF